MADRFKERSRLEGYRDGLKGEKIPLFTLGMSRDYLEGIRQGGEALLKNEDLAERITEKTGERFDTERVVERVVIVKEAVRSASSSDDDCRCPVHKAMAKITSSHRENARMTGIEQLRKIISRLKTAKPDWCLCGSCGIYGTFKKPPKGYEVVIGYDDYLLRNLLPDAIFLAFLEKAKISREAAIRGLCFDSLLIIENGEPLVNYNPAPLQWDARYRNIDTPERSWGRNFIVSIVKPIMEKRELDARRTEKIRKGQEGLVRRKQMAKANSFFMDS